MTVQDNESRSPLSSDGAELSNGDGSVCSSTDKSANRDNLTTGSDSEDLSTRTNVAASHRGDVANMPAKTFTFLKLPPELRMRVYYYVFCLDPKWYFDTFRLRTRCLGCDDEEPPSGMRIPCECLDDDGFLVAGRAKEPILSLLRTCREIYQEARYEIFKYNTFYFDDYSDDDRVTFKPLLPVQRSAIQNISMRLNTYSSNGFGFQLPELCKWLLGFEGLRSADLHLWDHWDPEPIGHDLHGHPDNWEKGISLLQNLGSLHWVGVMDPDERMWCTISGRLRLRLGKQPSAKHVNGKPADEGFSGNELKFLYWNNRVSWQKLPEEWMKN